MPPKHLYRKNRASHLSADFVPKGYVRTQSGTFIQSSGPDQRRRYSRPKAPDDESLRKAYQQKAANSGWFKGSMKTRRSQAKGKAHCVKGQWLLGQRGIDQSHCLLMPTALDHRRELVKYNYSTMVAARAMLIATKGLPPEEGMCVAHKCGQGHLSCVNPAHLYWADSKQNALDRVLHDPKTAPIEVEPSIVGQVAACPEMPQVTAWKYGVPISQVMEIKGLGGDDKKQPDLIKELIERHAEAIKGLA